MNQRFFTTIRGRFFLIIIAIMLITGLSTAALGYNLFSRNLRDNQIHSAETNLQFLKSSIDSDISDIVNFCQTTSSINNNNIMDFITTGRDMPSYNTITTTSAEWLNAEYLANNAHQYMNRVVIANQNREDFLQIVADTSFSTGKSIVPLIKELDYYDELIASELNHSFTLGVRTDPFPRTNAEEIIPIIRPIYSKYNNDVIGFTYIQVSFRLFTDPLLQYARQENISVYLTMGDENYRLSRTGITEVDENEYKLLGSPDLDLPLQAETTVNTISNSEGTDLYVSSSLSTGGCYITIPLAEQFAADHMNNYILLLFLICFLIMAVIGTFLFFSLNHTVTIPIRLLKTKIHAITRENFAPDPSIEWENELGDIGRALNKMGVDIQNLMTEKIENEKQKKDYEYQVLQSQINPHFLYNTLNSIKWMATIQNAPGIAEMTTALAHLLKNIAKGTSTIVSLKDEITLLDEYFTIQKYRYGGTITLSYDIEDEELLNQNILRFTLQPIVENAIFHGIEPKGQTGKIVIRICRDENNVRIDVTDNGVGMDEEMIQRVLSEESNGKSQFFRQIGIASVNRRIQYNFGIEYGLTITSIPGEYTTMTILLPKRPKDRLTGKLPGKHDISTNEGGN